MEYFSLASLMVVTGLASGTGSTWIDFHAFAGYATNPKVPIQSRTHKGQIRVLCADMNARYLGSNIHLDKARRHPLPNNAQTCVRGEVGVLFTVTHRNARPFFPTGCFV